MESILTLVFICLFAFELCLNTMFLLPSSTMYLQVDIICFEALSACSAILFFAECFKTQKKIFRISLIVIAIISALIALIYRYGLGVRVIRSRYPRSKLREDFNYNIWSKILRRYVSPKSGKINYRALMKKKELLEEFIGQLSVFGPESTPSLFTSKYDKMAYWINAYNALVIFAILEYFPISSILNVRTGFCCCSSSDYYLYYKNMKKKKKKKKKKKRKYKHNHHNNNHHKKGNNNNDHNNNGINIKYININKEKDKEEKEIKCIKEKQKEKKHLKRARKMENQRNYKKCYWFFEAIRFEVDGSLYSLREIERDIICSKFADSDARILCCINKQCIGSPKLLNKPFESHTLNDQLNAMNRMFCSGMIKPKDLCIRDNNICISSLFKHFKPQYIKYAKKNQWVIANRHSSIDNDNGALLGYIYHFANKEMRNKLSYPIIAGYCIKYIEFDWRLSIHKSKRYNENKQSSNLLRITKSA